MQNKEKTRYICPPKLQSKLLIAFWTVTEVLIFIFILMAGVGMKSPFILGILFMCIIMTGRFDTLNNPDKNMLTKVKSRIKYYRSIRTYKQITAETTVRKK